ASRAVTSPLCTPWVRRGRLRLSSAGAGPGGRAEAVPAPVIRASAVPPAAASPPRSMVRRSIWTPFLDRFRAHARGGGRTRSGLPVFGLTTAGDQVSACSRVSARPCRQPRGLRPRGQRAVSFVLSLISFLRPSRHPYTKDLFRGSR